MTAGSAAAAAVPALSAVVPTWNGLELLQRCLPSVVESVSAVGGEVVVVDDGSADGTCAWLRAHYPGARLVSNASQLGFTASINRGLAAARGRDFLLLNNDVVLNPGAVRGLMEFLDRPDQARTAAVSPRLLNEDGSLQSSCMSLPTVLSMYFDEFQLTRLWPRHPYRRRDWILRWNYSGTAVVGHAGMSCLLVRRAAAEQAGPLDERMRIMSSDVDWTLAMARHGWQTAYCAEYSVTHLGSRSIRRPQRAVRVRLYRDLYYFYRKQFGLLALPVLPMMWLRILLAHVRFPARVPDGARG